MLRHFSHILFFLLLLPLTAAAQRYSFIEYGLKEGLVQSQVRCLYQDSRGYIWAGTLGGLSRFDGLGFVNYDRQDGLPGNQVNCFLELNNGDLLVGMNGALAVVNGQGISSIPLPEKFKEASVNALLNDSRTGQILVGTDEGLLTLSGNTISDPEFSGHVRAMCTLLNGDVLVTMKEGLYVLSLSGFKPYWEPSAEEDLSFFEATQSPDGFVWVATKGAGLLKLFEGKEVYRYNHQGEMVSSTLTGILQSRKGEFWLCSRFGFTRTDGLHFKHFDNTNGLPVPDVRDIMEDREGNIWLATYGAGMLRYTGDGFSAFTTKEGLSSNAVMSICQSRDGVIWLSTFDGGLNKMATDTIQPIAGVLSDSNNRIWASAEDNDGVMWFGTSDGLYSMNQQGTLKQFPSDSLPDRMVLELFRDSQGRIWVGTAKGACYLQEGRAISIDAPKEMETRVRSIREDRTGALWFGTLKGVFRKSDNWSFYGKEQGLPDLSVYCLEVDQYNRVWAGTQNGLSHFHNGTFRTTTLDDVGAANTLNFLHYSENVLWIGTNNGLYRMVCGQEWDENAIQLRHFGLEEGLLSLETNLNACYTDHQNRLWFGTTEGVMVIDKSVLQQNPQAVVPELNLVDLRINLLKQKWTMPCDRAFGLPISPVFGYKQNHLTFYFNGISTGSGKEVVYQYYLEGLDEDWKAQTSSNFATYSNLPYKSFVLHVRSRVADGPWSNEVTYAFSIKPPFWLTWWFILLEIAMVSGIVGYFVLIRRRVVSERQEKEQFQMKSRMLALEQQSLNSSMNRHFIFNALNSIQYYINRQDKLAANRYLSDFAKLIRKNLDNSAENMATLREEIERLGLYLKLEHMRFQDKFEYSVTVDPALEQDKIKVPAMLVQPFLENSIWHGLLPKKEAGRLDVMVKKLPGQIEWIITDNGVGIENSLSSKTSTDDHISKGMEITANRIELIKKMTGLEVKLHGPYQLEAKDNNTPGTRVEIILPDNFHELF